MKDDFYIGWEAKAAPDIAKAMRKVVAGLVLLALTASALLAVSQRMIGASVFEWGNEAGASPASCGRNPIPGCSCRDRATMADCRAAPPITSSRRGNMD